MNKSTVGWAIYVLFVFGGMSFMGTQCYERQQRDRAREAQEASDCRRAKEMAVDYPHCQEMLQQCRGW